MLPVSVGDGITLRERVVELALATLLVVAISTELLSIFHALNPLSVALVWAGIIALWVWGLRKLEIRWKCDWWVLGLGTASFGLWAVEGLTAIVSPPNSSDAMAYHMPRVIYWIQQRSVEFFATPYLNQIMLQPMHEFVILHFQLLSGGDRFANSVAWLSTGGYIVAASLLAKALGASSRGQALAALLAATLPNGILQASGAKNEALLSFLLVSLVYFALVRRTWLVAMACGLACFTKGTAFIFAAPLILLLIPRAIPPAALLVLLINGAFFVRNIDLSGSPLGFDSAHADGKYRWRNEYIGWQPMLSNLMRHTSEQLGARNEGWNQAVYQAAIQGHQVLSLQPNDPATTWPMTEFVAPRSANHETDTNNRWHLALIFVGLAIFAWKRERIPLLILAAAALGVLCFCLYLKWQPFMLRMWLPLFLVAVSTAALALSRWPIIVQVVVVVFLLDGCRLPLLKSWVRPLQGPQNILQAERQDLYYNDMKTWHVRQHYDEVIATLFQSKCTEIAIDITNFQLEYPIQALLLSSRPETRFVHVNTQNPSRKYEHRMASIKPCQMVCLSCDRWLLPSPPK